ncbi:MAG: lysostaphin resistance A-like protein [Bellilinea sp.]
MKPHIKIFITIFAALALQVLTWFALYPLAGYNEVSLLAAQSLFLLTGIILVGTFRLNWRSMGGHWKDFLRAVFGIGVVYGLLLMILLALKHSGADLTIFRHEYRFYPLLNNWLLTGFGEELLFAGILFNLLTRFTRYQSWAAVIITASIFALWHLPGYLAIGLRSGLNLPDLALNLLLHLVSWLFLGTIYLLTGNLWLTAFAHASTDYPLFPAITTLPQIGLIFMFIVLAIGYLIKRKTQRYLVDSHSG